MIPKFLLIVLALLAINNSYLHKLDENNVFLVILEGVSCYKYDPVCKLLKPFYGLNKLAKWYEKLTSPLIVQGYTQGHSNHS